jgi:thiamine pyrophosphate-dependent acetolactate synthase large subunit-like protein
LFCQFESGLQYEQIAIALGADGAAVSSNDELEAGIRHLLESDQPCCLNIHVDPATPPLPIW